MISTSYFRATENADEKGGSFDASGAFHGPGWSDQEEPSAENRGGVGGGGGHHRQKSTSPDKTIKPRANVQPKVELGKKEAEPEENGKSNGVESDGSQDKSNHDDTGHEEAVQESKETQVRPFLCLSL